MHGHCDTDIIGKEDVARITREAEQEAARELGMTEEQYQEILHPKSSKEKEQAKHQEQEQGILGEGHTVEDITPEILYTQPDIPNNSPFYGTTTGMGGGIGAAAIGIVMAIVTLAVGIFVMQTMMSTVMSSVNTTTNPTMSNLTDISTQIGGSWSNMFSLLLVIPIVLIGWYILRIIASGDDY
jgi:hypothetical protein